MLYLISTPIGNLSDFSFRAVETLQACDYLLCEDTRKSQILLDHYQIKKNLKSYHRFNEEQKLQSILSDLKQGLSIGLLSDGGTPALCDPGSILVKACLQQHIAMTALPGPCALVLALILSGFPTQPFQFFGFLPRKESDILALLPMVFSFPGTSIFYESPHRLLDTLSLLQTVAPLAEIAIARELTKTFEEVLPMTVSQALTHFSSRPPKGEIVLLFKGCQDPMFEKEPKLLVKELIDTYHLSQTEAIKTAAHLLKMQKNQIYQLFHRPENST